MTTIQESTPIPDYPLDVSMEAFADMANIMSALGNEDALAIFLYAKNGIHSSKDAIRTLTLTQKKFYTRLKDLLDNKLIEKMEGTYSHTSLGSIMFNMWESLQGLLVNKEKLEVLETIRRSSNISPENTKQIMEALKIDLSYEKTELGVVPYKIKMVETYEALSEGLIEEVEKASKSIYFASKYTDEKVVEATISALQRNVNVSLLCEKMSISQGVQVLKMLLSPKSISTFGNFIKEYSHIIKQTSKLVNSFIIIDEKIAIVEIPHPTRNRFHLGFIFENPDVCTKLVKIFRNMWENSEEYNIF